MLYLIQEHCHSPNCPVSSDHLSPVRHQGIQPSPESPLPTCSMTGVRGLIDHCGTALARTGGRDPPSTYGPWQTVYGLCSRIGPVLKRLEGARVGLARSSLLTFG